MSVLFSILFVVVAVYHASNIEEYDDGNGGTIFFVRHPLNTSKPTTAPTNNPTHSPTLPPTNVPTASPTNQPTVSPSKRPTKQPTLKPSKSPTMYPTFQPTSSPTEQWDSKTSARIRNKKQNKQSSNTNQDSKLLKIAIQAQSPPKASKLKDEVEIYFHDQTVEDHAKIVEKFETDLAKDINRYNLIITNSIESFDYVANKKSDKVICFWEPLEAALHHQSQQMKFFHVPSITMPQFQNSIALSIHLLAGINDEPIYYNILKEFTSEWTIMNTTADDAFHQLLTECYVKAVEQQKESSNKLESFQFVIDHDAYPRYIELALLFNRVSLKSLINGKMDQIDRIYTNSSYGNDGKIPSKVRKSFAAMKLSGALCIEHSVNAFYNNAMNYLNGNESDPRLHLNAKIAGKQYQSKVEEFCGALSRYYFAMHTVRTIYEWRKADIKNNHGTIAISAPLFDGQEPLIYALLTNIDYSPSSIKRFMIIANGPKKYTRQELTEPIPEYPTGIQISSKRKKKATSKKMVQDATNTSLITQMEPINVTSITQMEEKQTVQQDMIRVYVINKFEMNCDRYFLSVANNPDNDVVIMVKKTHLMPQQIKIAKNRYNVIQQTSQFMAEAYCQMQQFLQLNIAGSYKIWDQIVDHLENLIYRLTQWKEKERHIVLTRMIKTTVTKPLISIILRQVKKAKESGRRILKNELDPATFNDDPLIMDVINFFRICIEEVTLAQMGEMNQIFYNSSYSESGKLPKWFITEYEQDMNQTENYLFENKQWMYWLERHCRIRANKQSKKALNAINRNFCELYAQFTAYTIYGHVGQILYDWKKAGNNGTVAIVLFENLLKRQMLLDILKDIGYESASVNVVEL